MTDGSEVVPKFHRIKKRPGEAKIGQQAEVDSVEAVAERTSEAFKEMHDAIDRLAAEAVGAASSLRQAFAIFYKMAENRDVEIVDREQAKFIVKGMWLDKEKKSDAVLGKTIMNTPIMAGSGSDPFSLTTYREENRCTTTYRLEVPVTFGNIFTSADNAYVFGSEVVLTDEHLLGRTIVEIREHVVRQLASHLSEAITNTVMSKIANKVK